MAALLSSDQDNIDRVTIEIKECRKMGLEVLAPDVNESFSNFSVVEAKEKNQLGKIRFGLNAVKNVGHNIAKVIIKERKANGFYQSVENLLSRIKDKDLNKKSLESLIKAGALDSLIKRGQALGNLDKLLEFNKKIQNDYKNGQSNLFADLPLAAPIMSLKLDDYPDTDKQKRLSWEKELLGLYISDHPFKKNLEILKNSITSIKQLKNKEGQSVKVAGIITSVHKIVTHKGQAMLFVTIEDSNGSVELVVFPKILETSYQLWKDENQVIAEGKVSEKDGQPKLLVERAELISAETINDAAIKNMAEKKLWLKLPPHFNKEDTTKLKQILQNKKGLTPVYLEISNGQKRIVKTDLKVLPAEELKNTILEFLGQDSWKLTDN